MMKPEARTTGIVVQEVNGELLVYDLDRDEAHCLNAATSFVWRHADGTANVGRLVELARQQAVDGVDDAVVLSALDSLSDAHLLIEPIRQESEADLQSRRQMIRRVAAIGGIAAAAAITSIVAPTPAQAQTRTPDPCKDPTNPLCPGND